MASTRKIGMFLALTLIGLTFVAAIPGAQAKSVDRAILDELQSAPEREQRRIAQTIEERLRNARPTPAIQRRLVKILAHSQHLSTHNHVTMLRELGSGTGLDELTIIAVANGLAADIVHSSPSAETLGQLLIGYGKSKRLPDLAVSSVYDAIAHPNRSNPTPAIRVLKSLPVTDARFVANTQVLVTALNAEFPYVRTSAIDALVHYGSQVSLPDFAVAALKRVATSDSHIHVRLDAYTALGAQRSADRLTLAQSLASELTAPTAEVWQASSGFTGYSDQESRAITLLTGWLEPTYPDYAVDALIAQTPRQHRVTLPLLTEVERNRPLSAGQRSSLEEVAQRHYRAEVRRDIYRLIEGTRFSGPAEQVLSVMEHDSSPTAQIQAAYRIERHYQALTMPNAVTEVAERLLMTSEHAELRGIAARLVARSHPDSLVREQTLIAALRLHTSDDEIRKAWFAMYDDDQFELLVEKYVADDSLAPWIRSSAVTELGKLATPGKALREGTYASMVYAGRTTHSYSLNASIFGALGAWHEKVPLSVMLKYAPYQAQALFAAFVILAVVFIGAGLISLVKTFAIPFAAPGRTAKRVMMLLVWLVLSGAGLALFAFALFGFFGHNSAPDPRHSLNFNIPMYIGVVVFLTYTWVVTWWSKRRH